jgi:hypothetical protein
MQHPNPALGLSEAAAGSAANAAHPHDLITAANGNRPRVPPTLEPRRSTRGR